MEIKSEYYNHTAYVEQVGETQLVGSNGFKKREIVLSKRNEKYSPVVKFTFKKDNVARLDGIQKDDIVKISFYPDGRAWNGPKGVVYFTELVGYKCEILEKAHATTPQPAQPEQDIEDNDCEDLPF